MIYPKINFRNFIKTFTIKDRFGWLSNITSSFCLFGRNLCWQNFHIFDKFNLYLRLMWLIHLLRLGCLDVLEDNRRLSFLFSLVLRVFVIFFNLCCLLYGFSLMSINRLFTRLIILFKKLQFLY